MSGGQPRDPWAMLAKRTPARVAIGRAGASLPTREVLAFALAHARARDAVNARIDWPALAERLRGLGMSPVMVASLARSRAVYLRRPDLGRLLDADSAARLSAAAAGPPCDLVFVVGDGLSATAVAAQAPELLAALLPMLARLGVRVGPVVLAEGARVALGDAIGATLGARLVAVLIGERPGLSAADSLSAYLTYEAKPGRTDAERNCISNIRPEGLAPAAAAANLAWLIEAALQRRLTGVALKDLSDATAVASGGVTQLK